ncbi:hypothetical protein KM043_009347 [Ampulex compressa]|nr:hypothetical protein KM043_009347 [Ampulex compressa]
MAQPVFRSAPGTRGGTSKRRRRKEVSERRRKKRRRGPRQMYKLCPPDKPSSLLRGGPKVAPRQAGSSLSDTNFSLKDNFALSFSWPPREGAGKLDLVLPSPKAPINAAFEAASCTEVRILIGG